MIGELSPHDTVTIHPYVLQDLQKAYTTDRLTWFAIVFGIPARTLRQWATKINKERWLEDEIVAVSLRKFCSASKEVERYQPFIDLANRILDLAPGHLPGIPETDPYPVDLRFAMHYKHMVAPIPEHGVIAAERRPDIVLVRREHAERLAKNQAKDEKESVRWVDIVSFWELKYESKLDDLLEQQMLLDDEESASDWKLGDNRKRALPSTSIIPKDRQAKRPRNKAKKTSDVKPRDDVDRKSREQQPPDELAEHVRKADEQLAAYALELLSCTYGTRLYCAAAILRDQSLAFWSYGSSGILHSASSQNTSLIDEFGLAAAMIVAFGSRTPEQYGALPTDLLKPPSTLAFPHGFPLSDLSGCSLSIDHPKTSAKVNVTLQKNVFTQYTLAGRRTFVYRAMTDVDVGSDKLIIKFSYQVCTRRPEHELISCAYEAGIDPDYLPEVHLWGDLRRFEDIGRTVARRGRRKMETQPYEDRILRTIIYTEYYPLRTLFASHCEAIPLMVDQMIDCLHQLWTKARILHRDLSVNNIMWEVRDGRLRFRLIDWDMATVVPQAGDPNGGTYVVSASHRTGTLPFMHWELVRDAWKSADPPEDWKPIAHLLRHDYASLYFISLWCAELLPTNDVEMVDLQRLIERAKGLEKGGLERIASYKKDVCTNPLLENNIRLPTSANCLKRWFKKWIRLFSRSAALEMWERESFDETESDAPGIPGSMNSSKFDWETGGGRFTRDKLKEELTPLIPTQLWTINELKAACTAIDADHGPNFLLPSPANSHRSSVQRPLRKRSERHPPALRVRAVGKKSNVKPASMGTTTRSASSKRPAVKNISRSKRSPTQPAMKKTANQVHRDETPPSQTRKFRPANKTTSTKKSAPARKASPSKKTAAAKETSAKRPRTKAAATRVEPTDLSVAATSAPIVTAGDDIRSRLRPRKGRH